MLAIKECLMREGAFNNHHHNISSNNINNNNNNNKNNRNMINHKYQLQSESVASQSVDFPTNLTSSNNLSLTSTTANTSCQQQQQQLDQQQKQQRLQEQESKNISLNNSKKSITRYQGHHPHFRHHTTPAYYTDVHLRIHTPDAADVAALNENYRSVYSTPSKLLAGEHYFTKSATATVAPPPIGSNTSISNSVTGGSSHLSSSPKNTLQQQRSAFFRGAFSAANPEQQTNLEPYTRSSPPSANPIKGELSTEFDQQQPHPDGNVLYGCLNLKPSVRASSLEYKTSAAELGCAETAAITATPSPRSGRLTQRFNNRKRAVRVRSESRPISALYDIICKEKGLDNGTSTTTTETTTNDEDSSSASTAATPSHNDAAAHKDKHKDKTIRHKSKKHTKSKAANMSVQSIESPSLVGTNSTISSNSLNINNNNHEQTKRSTHARLLGKHTKKRIRPESTTATTPPLVINDLNLDDDDDDTPDEQQRSHAMSPRLTLKSNGGDGSIKSSQAKASSLPPYKLSNELMNQHQLHQQHQHHHHYLQQCARNDSSHDPSNSSSHSLQTVPSLNHSLNRSVLRSPSYSPLDATYHALSRGNSVSQHNGLRDQSTQPSKLYIEPVKLPHPDNPAAVGRNERLLRSTGLQRRFTEEQRRKTDGAASMIPTASSGSITTSSGGAVAGASAGSGYRSSDGEQQSGSLTGLNQSSSNARRFITRPNRTPSRGRSQLSGGIPSPQRSDSSSPHRFSPTNISSTAVLGEPESLLRLHIANGNQQEFIENPYQNTSECSLLNGQKSIALAKASPATVVMTNSAPSSSTAAPAVQMEENCCSTAAAAATTVLNNDDDIESAAPNVISADKKKDLAHQQQQQQRQQEQSPQRFSSPTSPRYSPRVLQSPRHIVNNKTYRRHSSSSDNPQKSPTEVSSESDQKNSSATSSPSRRLRSAGGFDSSIPTKKLVPTMVSLSMKQNLIELQFNGESPTLKRKQLQPPHSPRPQQQPAETTECTVRIIGSTKKTSSSPAFADEAVEDETVMRPRTSTMYSEENRGNSSSKSSSARSKENSLELSPITKKSQTPESSPRHLEDRDKSSKRKSNLNRSLNEEATHDGDETAAARRRRRRELGMARQLIPNDDPALREIISPQKSTTINTATFVVNSPKSPRRNNLAYHMENARRGLDLVSPPNAAAEQRRRAQTASPKVIESPRAPTAKPDSKLPSPGASRISRRSDTLPLGGGVLRKMRSNDVNRKLNERTKSDLAEIMKIAEMANDDQQPPLAQQPLQVPVAEVTSNSYLEMPHNDALANLSQSMERIRASNERELAPAESLPATEDRGQEQSQPSPTTKHATFVKESHTHYYDHNEPLVSPDNSTLDDTPQPGSSSLHRKRMLKARSVDRDDGSSKFSPILRRKSTADEPSQLAVNTTSSFSTAAGSAHNHIVSILKKNPGESSSASSNASPVTFSASVMDTPTRHKRAGILKKRSSLDESRYYSRSHSPDERSILIKSARRNSLEETAAAAAASGQQHGILKQSSYDSCKSDGCPSATESYPHGILKKKDSSSTPSDGGTHAPKHVSISQAVILAAAELCKDSATESAQGEYDGDGGSYTPGNEDYDLRPILKLESATSDDAMRQPKPILKKKSSSGESDELEIRPILKTSRKSSREEFDISSSGQSSDEARQLGSEYGMRPILKTESPCKRRSLGGAELEGMSSSQLSLLQRRTRSLERTGDSSCAATPPLPGMDLAAALNAIGPQTTSTPLDFGSKPSTIISVADRIKNMEKFLVSANSTTSPTSTSPPHIYSTPYDQLNEDQAATNTSWESPLQSGAVPKLYRPSVIKREFYRYRYKTQPVTSEEKNMFFKTTSSPFDTNSPTTNTTNTVAAASTATSAAAPSAFKPTKSLDALNYVAFANLNSESPTSPPRATSSHSLARSATQPIQVVINSATYNTNNTPYRSRLYNNNNNTTSNNISEQLTVSVGSDSERIFDMSSLGDEDSSMQDTSQETVNCGSPRTSNQKNGDNEHDIMKTPTSIGRTNSVRARANMFAQLQEKTKLGTGSTTSAISREERTSPRSAAPRRLSPAPQAVPSEEPKTPNNPPPNSDDEIEPSSLPLSERLRFFSNLSSASRSNFMSYTRSSPTQQRYSHNGTVERSASAYGYTSFYSHNTPRSSLSNTSGSSVSVTPTPMECSLGTTGVYGEEDNDDDDDDDDDGDNEENDDAVSISTSIDMTSSDTHSTTSIGCRGVESVNITTSAYVKLSKSASHSHVPTQNPITTLTPTTRRIKLKTIGKLMLPQTFLGTKERNNNSNNMHSNASDTSENNSLDSVDKSILKKIGKIKSPFIENCQQLQQKQQQLNSKCMKYDLRSSPSYSHVHAGDSDKDNNECVKQNGDDNNVAELGKENIDLSSAYKLLPQKQQTAPVVEMRKKFTRIMNGTHTTNTTPSLSRLHTAAATQRHTYNGSSPIIDEKYAKYFGLSPTSAATAAKQETDSEQKAVSVSVVKRNMQNISERCRTKPPLVTQRHLDLDELMLDASPVQQPVVAAVNPNVRLISNNAVNNSLKRREVAKRSRAMTTILNGTSPKTPPSIGVGAGNGYAGRTLRAGRSLTITHGVKLMTQVPEVHRFEDITVTKEEFQLASKEFERIFLGIA